MQYLCLRSGLLLVSVEVQRTAVLRPGQVAGQKYKYKSRWAVLHDPSPATAALRPGKAAIQHASTHTRNMHAHTQVRMNKCMHARTHTPAVIALAVERRRVGARKEGVQQCLVRHLVGGWVGG